MKTLRSYLRDRLIILGSIILLPLTILTFSLYELGLDDSTELYLYEDLEWAKSELQAGRALPQNNRFRQFYLGKEKLPLTFRKEINSYKAAVASSDPYIYWETSHLITYGITDRYQGQQLYVFHSFEKDNSVDGIQLETVVLFLIMGVMLIMLLGSLGIYRKISESMFALNLLSNYSKDAHGLEEEVQPINIEFSEVNEVSKSIHSYVDGIKKNSRNEQYFIQSLSHELRTPMAIIQVAVELLKKQNRTGLSGEKLEEKLDTIFTANARMQALSNNLLGLWSGELSDVSRPVVLSNLIETTVDDLNRHYSLHNRIELAMPSGVIECKGTDWLVGIVLINLIKNAIIHGVKNQPIQILLDSTELKIINGIDRDKSADAATLEGSKSSESIGMGLFIVERAIDQLSWSMKVTKGDDYEVKIMFMP